MFPYSRNGECWSAGQGCCLPGGAVGVSPCGIRGLERGQQRNCLLDGLPQFGGTDTQTPLVSFRNSLHPSWRGKHKGFAVLSGKAEHVWCIGYNKGKCLNSKCELPPLLGCTGQGCNIFSLEKMILDVKIFHKDFLVFWTTKEKNTNHNTN